MKRLLLILAFVLQGCSTNPRINVTVASIHSEEKYTVSMDEYPYTESEVYFDESNPGIGLEFPLNKAVYAAIGAFDNSLAGTTISVYGGLGIDFVKIGNYALCAEVALTSGYEDGNLGGDICVKTKLFSNHGVKLHYAPGESFGMAADVYAIEYQYYIY